MTLKIKNKHQMIDAYERWFWLMHQANGSYEDEKVEILSIMLKEYVGLLRCVFVRLFDIVKQQCYNFTHEK